MFQNKLANRAAVCLATASLALGGAGCEQQRGSGFLPRSGPAAVTELGAGVYQLPAREWPKNLVEFKKDHPELRIVDTQVATDTGHGAATSFIVITEPVFGER
jgi:hypothetical protein